MPKLNIKLESTPLAILLKSERKVAPNEEKMFDHIFMRSKKISTRYFDGFATEEIAKFNIAWSEQPIELKESSKANKKIEIISK